MKEFIKEQTFQIHFVKLHLNFFVPWGKKISNVFPIILRKVKWDIRKKKTNQLQVCYATQIYSTLGINQLEQLELIRLQL